MAFQPITNPEIATGAPIDAALLGKVKNNLDSHESDIFILDDAINDQEVTINSVQNAVDALEAANDAFVPGTLTSSGGQIAINLATKLNFAHTMTENTTLANPTNAVAGQSGQIFFTQHASTARTLAFGSNWKSTDGFTATISTTLSAKNLLTYYVASPTEIWFVLLKRGVV